jgi:hypothetical protein
MATTTKTHSAVINDWTQKTAVNTSLTAHQQDISDLADTIYTPPVTIDSSYLTRCTHAAQLLGTSVPPPPDPQQTSDGTAQLPIPNDWNRDYPQGNPLEPWDNLSQDTDSNSTVAIRNAALAARNAVFDVISEVNAFISQASNTGFAPPTNPFSQIAVMNAGRVAQNPVNVTSAQADQLMSDITQYLSLLQQQKDGTLNLNSNTEATAQLSSVTLSFDGFGGSGQSAVDIMKFLPNMDMIASQKALQALSVLDFRKRIPSVIFTANYSPSGTSKGCLVGWKKMSDAAGYILSRRNMFDQSVVQFTLTNDQMDTLKTQLDDYVQTWVLTFYDNIDPTQVYTYLDGTAQANAYYIYTLQAYQLQDNGKTTVFSVDTSVANLSKQQRTSVQQQLTQLAKGTTPGDDPSVLSPYPVLAQSLLGNSAYDWILAGVNIQAAINRNESNSTIRQFSYLTANLQFLYSQMDAGKFVVPKNGNIQTVSSAITSKLSQFGVSQVLYELMQQTEILYFFEGVDAGVDPAFSKISAQSPQSSNLLAVIVSSIDPETLIMDLSTLASNLPQLLAGGLLKNNTVVQPGVPQPGAGAAEIEMDPTSAQSPSEIQFMTQMANLGTNDADLTTFDGISDFVRVIRIFSDYGANRSQATIGGAVISLKSPISTTTNAASIQASNTQKYTSDQQKQQAQQQAKQTQIQAKESNSVQGGTVTRNGTRTYTE